ncbi:hypothetical protein AZG88_38340 [Rhodococcus sp. LB1]|nr:hypothetical protein AZG88_38340 [Rhodococcus sp. LB1]
MNPVRIRTDADTRNGWPAIRPIGEVLGPVDVSRPGLDDHAAGSLPRRHAETTKPLRGSHRRYPSAAGSRSVGGKDFVP